MEQTTIVAIISAIFTAGISYGMLNTRIKTLEVKMQEHKDINEKFARIEERLNFLIEHFVNK
jgi:hypothetical protein